MKKARDGCHIFPDEVKLTINVFASNLQSTSLNKTSLLSKLQNCLSSGKQEYSKTTTEYKGQ